MEKTTSRSSFVHTGRTARVAFYYSHRKKKSIGEKNVSSLESWLFWQKPDMSLICPICIKTRISIKRRRFCFSPQALRFFKKHNPNIFLIGWVVRKRRKRRSKQKNLPSLNDAEKRENKKIVPKKKTKKRSLETIWKVQLTTARFCFCIRKALWFFYEAGYHRHSLFERGELFDLLSHLPGVSFRSVLQLFFFSSQSVLFACWLFWYRHLTSGKEVKFPVWNCSCQLFVTFLLSFWFSIGRFFLPPFFSLHF